MTKSPKEAAAAAEEIRVLQEQMKEMQRRLDALCAEQSADVEDVENDESSSQDAESVSGPDEANAASGASSQDAYSVSEQAAYQPPVNPVSGYTAQQTQPFVGGARSAAVLRRRRTAGGATAAGVLRASHRATGVPKRRRFLFEQLRLFRPDSV